MAIINIVNPETRIGFDILPSLCFFFAKLGFYLCLAVIQGWFLCFFFVQFQN
jgi:hypothetical protein